jgi:hypothetical protein
MRQVTEFEIGFGRPLIHKGLTLSTKIRVKRNFLLGVRGARAFSPGSPLRSVPAPPRTAGHRLARRFKRNHFGNGQVHILNADNGAVAFHRHAQPDRLARLLHEASLMSRGWRLRFPNRMMYAW